MLDERVEGDLDITENTCIKGEISGRVTVAPGVSLRVQGQIKGQLILLPGSFVTIHGIVDGDVQNESGALKIYGTVNGAVITPVGITRIDPSAKVLKVVSMSEDSFPPGFLPPPAVAK